MKFNDESVERSASLPVLVGKARPGEKATVTVLRNGKEKTLKLKAGELAKQAHVQEQEQAPEVTNKSALGLAFQDRSSAR